jgi:hypothetical protein
MKLFLFPLLLCCAVATQAQPVTALLDSFSMYGDVRITIDWPSDYHKKKETLIVLYALPNGNTTAQTMGRQVQLGDDWHYNIQHIKAQTGFIRQELKKNNVVVCYLENSYKSWSLWKQKHPEGEREVQAIVDTLYGLFPAKRKTVCLNGHSGGGRFIFSYMAAVPKIPLHISRITFLDSNYGYDSTFTPKLVHWLKSNPSAQLSVFAYNDSIALYNGKPFVSPTGGTWYKSHQMLRDLAKSFLFQHRSTDSLEIYRSAGGNITFFLKPNYDRGIYHTQQVELNGFIHSILLATPQEEKGYKYYGNRAYTPFIQ